MAEYFLHPVSETHAAWVAFPPLADCPLDDRAAFMADLPPDVLEAAPVVPLAAFHAAPIDPSPSEE